MVENFVLSIFPGAGLLDKAFEEKFCIVRGPDLLWGGDIRRFNPPANVFQGVIGGPPCQEFSGLFRGEPTGYGLEMLREFVRVVDQAQPEWFLMENVARVPDIFVEGYFIQRIDINQGWYGDSTRLRHIQFGSKSGRQLHIERRSVTGSEPAALASDNRSFREVCKLQGLPKDFDLPPFKVAEKIRAVGNGVPLEMGRALAQAIIDAYAKPAILQKTLFNGSVPASVCACGCGRQVTRKKTYYDFSCRKRAQRKRQAAQSQA